MKVGIALGGGGVRGLAHIPVLEILDELAIRPCMISGTSMGAIIGALYASGMAGHDIRTMILDHVILDRDGLWDVYEKKENLLKWVSVFKANFTRGGLINARGFIEYLFHEIKARTFEDLQVPLAVVATDFWTGEQVVFERGPLLPALQASMAVPGVFAPVMIDGRVLVDGGAVNMIPYDLLETQADFTIAVNVCRVRLPGRHEMPTTLEAVMGTFEIMQSAVLAERMKYSRPDIYVCPELDVRLLDFGRIEDVLAQAMSAAEHLKRALAEQHAPALRKLKKILQFSDPH